MYQLNKNDNNEYTKSIKITYHNINVDEIKNIGYNDALIDEILNSKAGNTYYKNYKNKFINNYIIIYIIMNK